ncbi:transcription initiation factor TFIID subunit 11-like isoform X2 [Lingula anatina]|nr:transcription initiation factor TFIID subunit 11-like isoform X2 [Lingula anatina]XP_013406909.1 transcription initiation factor TFIID subunit 11-like isoform X2 [Lingula anatina]|eukprot:XP_013406908.1 transcription initiation factor TFIID subunit 11-like isoform X2 [Lingula anatina]
MQRTSQQTTGDDSDSSGDIPLSQLRTPRTQQKDPPGDPYKTPGVTPRASDRIRCRKARTFVMPNKRDVFDKIEVPSNGKFSSYEHLKPRRIVNDFIRVNHRYNFDPDYTSGEDSSLDGFLAENNSEEEEEEDEEDDEDTFQHRNSKKKKNCGLQKRRTSIFSSVKSGDKMDTGSKFKRIRTIADDSSDEDGQNADDSDSDVPMKKVRKFSHGSSVSGVIDDDSDD